MEPLITVVIPVYKVEKYLICIREDLDGNMQNHR